MMNMLGDMSPPPADSLEDAENLGVGPVPADRGDGEQVKRGGK